jgi:Domain of unknown function (DUF4396)
MILVDIVAGRRQKMPVMNYVWPIAALYFGPIALWAYGTFGRAGGPKEKPYWQSTFIGTLHCGAGCTIGDVIGEWLVFLAGLTVAGSVLLANCFFDFTFAFLAGIVFQYFSIAPMRHLGLREGIKAAVKADTVSILAFEIGMFAWMAITSKFLFHPRLEPMDPAYWFMMQIAMVIGFATSYPANWLLIRRGWKEAM